MPLETLLVDLAGFFAAALASFAQLEVP